ncbi:CPBP family intramembrane metalloprotease domain-containing protein [Phormidium sp. LEGE 05292]|uniref:CPBP family glutamic-type intramembrane protease n=1 Tax=[Phormidium] sp. LEGE 05292 TaxID=767427 RepID=UPI00187DE5C9|nr:CPBP family glutamic-type intramembrane protease [Phormidium sp. LEGE 05292]MBE9228283.1 CPBP family intramembrane metalloprotease domain-containing protein [Phormidium sp. LEGE 05292]
MQQWLRIDKIRGYYVAIILVIFSAILTILLHPTLLSAVTANLPPSQYSSTIKAPFNQPSYYPITAEVPANYRPVSDWVGRLILPSKEQYQEFVKTDQETDWAWFQVEVAPANEKNLIGKTVRLAWIKEPLVQAYVNKASRDTRFPASVQQSYENGVIHPMRLDNRVRVGPLQSLAGAHPIDDVTVILPGKVVVETATNESNSTTILRINREPFQETGRFYGLVKFLGLVPQKPQDLPQLCPGKPPCASDLMRVQHYNMQTHKFDGAIEIVRIPQQPPDNLGIFNMTTRGLDKSPAGKAGWYIYGAKDREGIFTVQAMQPRSLIEVKPQETISGFNQGLKFINFQNWQDVEKKKGTIESILLTGKTDGTYKDWKIGDRALVMHLYGGRGGTHPHAERFVLGTYAGHFSFGIAEVVRDIFTNEPIFKIDYLQVFGNSGDGTLSGGQTWAHYMGNMRRGFMGTRPVSDVLIKLDTLTKEYDFGGRKFSFFNELLSELSLVGARYRIGDGTGNSTITSATSCVQDSAQAIFLTLSRFQKKIENNPQIVQWMKDHPNDPNTKRFEDLVKLAKDLAKQLTPMGVVRWDWQWNANVLTGVYYEQKFISIDNFKPRNLLTGLISWRTALPRQANDEFSMLFLNNDAQLWFVRPNQIGGNDPNIAPLEPTLLLGAWKLPFTNIPIFSYLVIRTFGGVTIPSWLDWLKTLGILLGFGAIAIPIGFTKNFLSWQPLATPWYQQLGTTIKLLFVPALVQEYIFRVLLLPYPKDWFSPLIWWSWGFLALGIYVGYHLILAKWFGRSTFANPVFLLLVTLLGLACTINYYLIGSLWTITFMHWVAVTAWWLFFGGKVRSNLPKTAKQTN